MLALFFVHFSPDLDEIWQGHVGRRKRERVRACERERARNERRYLHTEGVNKLLFS
jgi:hypothetical protein